MEKSQSMIVSERITITEGELEVERQLLQLPNERVRIMSADHLDRGAMKTLDAQLVELQHEQEFLRRRLDVLADQKDQAERAEAQARLDQLPGIADVLAHKASAATVAFNEAAATVMEKARALAQIHREHYLLAHESAFLVERYGVTRHPLPDIGKTPTFEQLVPEISGLFEFHRQENPWARKRQQFSEERAKPVRRVA